MTGRVEHIRGQTFHGRKGALENAFRYGVLGTSDIDIVHAYAIVLLFVAVLFTACLVLLNRGVGIRE